MTDLKILDDAARYDKESDEEPIFFDEWMDNPDMPANKGADILKEPEPQQQ